MSREPDVKRPVCMNKHIMGLTTGFINRAQDMIFVLRCTLTAGSSYLLAEWLGLSYPIWASISSVVVAQDRLGDTNSAVIWRFAGTVVGVIVAVLTGMFLLSFTTSLLIDIVCCVSICATLVRIFPKLRVSMWTSQIVYFAQTPDSSLLQTGLWRGSEVLIGGVTAVIFHALSDLVMRMIRKENDD